MFIYFAGLTKYIEIFKFPVTISNKYTFIVMTIFEQLLSFNFFSSHPILLLLLKVWFHIENSSQNKIR